MLENYKKETVNVEYLSKLFGVDIRTVQLYAKNNGLPKDERGEYPLVECLLWYIKKLENNIADLQKENPLAVVRQEAIELNNQKKRLELEKQLGNLLDRELVTMINIAQIKMIVRNADAIAPRLTKKLNGDAKVLSIIQEVINEFKIFCAETPIEYYQDEVNKLSINENADTI